VETVTKWYGERSGHPREKMTAKPREDMAREGDLYLYWASDQRRKCVRIESRIQFSDRS
jgi:hypothetical protein